MEMSKMSNSSYLGLLIIGDSTHSAWPFHHYFWPLLPNFGQWNFKLKAKNTGTNCFWEEVPVISQNSSKSSIWKSLSISQSGREGTSNYLMGIEHQQSKCVQVKLKWVQGQHAQKNHWQATISLVSMDKIPTKCLNYSPWNTRGSEGYGHFASVLKTFGQDIKHYANICKGVGGENRAIHNYAHHIWELDDNCYCALCAPGPKPALVGNNWGPLFNVTNKPLEVCGHSLGLCCDFYLSTKTFRTLFSKICS